MKVKLTATAVVKVTVTTTAYITTIVIPATAASNLNKFQYFSSLWSRQIHVNLQMSIYIKNQRDASWQYVY
jgi:chorismate mutase